MTQPKETEMDTNDNARTNAPEEVIVLGVASIETKGQAGITENFGMVPSDGISDA